MSRDKPGFFSGENIRDKNRGITYSEKALAAKQVTVTEQVLAAQMETNRLLAELLARLPQREERPSPTQR